MTTLAGFVSDLRVQIGFADQDRRQVAQLFWAAFGSKLRLPLGPDDKAIEFLTRNVIPRFGLAAYRGETLLGVAGFKTDEGGLFGGDMRALADVYGWPSALWRGPLLGLLERQLAPDQLLMDGIFVDAAARGHGVGTALLLAVKSHAVTLGKSHVRLDVISDNPRAKALYEREGFRVTNTTTNLVARYLFGIKASSEMVWEVPD